MDCRDVCHAGVTLNAQAIRLDRSEMRSACKEEDLMSRARKRCTKRSADATGAYYCNQHGYPPLLFG